MSSGIAQVDPENAAPDIAEIYAEIASVTGIPTINLVWRHLATFPGALRWAWDSVVPVAGSAELETARIRIAGTLALPRLDRPALGALRSIGLTGDALARVRSVTEAYLQGNLTNLLALTALRMRLAEPGRPSGRLHAGRRAGPAPGNGRPAGPPGVSSLPPELVRRLQELSGHHEDVGDDVILGYYLELSAWPELVRALPVWLAPLYAPPALTAARDETIRLTRSECASLLPGTVPAPTSAPVAAVLDRFTEVVIPGAVPVCIAVRRILSDV